MKTIQLVTTAVVVFFGIASFAEESPRRILLFTESQSWVHAPSVSGPGGSSCCELVLRPIAKELGYELDWSCDGRIFDGEPGRYAAIIFYTCGNLNKKGDRPNITPGHVPMTAKGRKAFFDAVRGGTGFLGIHSALDTWYDKEYFALAGGRLFQHGWQQETTVRFVDGTTASTIGLWGKTFSLLEEWYCLTDFSPDIHVLMMQDTKNMNIQGMNACYNRPAYPCTWIRREGKGRVAYTSLGHSCEVWQMKEYRTLLSELLQIVVGKKEADFTPNLNAVQGK